MFNNQIIKYRSITGDTMTAKKALRHGKYPYHRAVNEVVWVTGLEIARWGFTKKREVLKTRTITGFVAGVAVAGFHRISRIFAGFPENNAQIMTTNLSGTQKEIAPLPASLCLYFLSPNAARMLWKNLVNPPKNPVCSCPQ